MVVVPVDQVQDQAYPNQQEPQDTNPLPHMPKPSPLPAHMPDQEQPPNQPPNPPPQAPMQPNNPQGNPPNPMQPQNRPAQVPQLSWSYFKTRVFRKTRQGCNSTPTENK